MTVPGSASMGMATANFPNGASASDAEPPEVIPMPLTAPDNADNNTIMPPKIVGPGLSSALTDVGAKLAAKVAEQPEACDRLFTDGTAVERLTDSAVSNNTAESMAAAAVTDDHTGDSNMGHTVLALSAAALMAVNLDRDSNREEKIGLR
jgi:hypothetical protein